MQIMKLILGEDGVGGMRMGKCILHTCTLCNTTKTENTKMNATKKFKGS